MTKILSLFNVEFNNLTIDELLVNFNNGILFTPNVDHIIQIQKDVEFYNCYKKADFIVCDSKILKLGASFLGVNFIEVIPGSSFFPAFYSFHKGNFSIKIFLLGAADGVAHNAMMNINRKVGWDMVVGNFSPSYGFESCEEECNLIIDLINNSGANVLVVGLGAPKQEKWIVNYKNKLNNIDRFLALGASIDFEANHINRAPKIFQILYLEWFYRFLMEPNRLFKRYFIDNFFPFLFLLINEKFNKNNR